MSLKMENRLRWLGAMFRIALGALFVFSGSLKILTPIEEFQALIREYHLMPELLMPVFSIALPILEVVIGACLILGLFERWSAFLISGMVVMFLVAITQALARGFPLANCGCFGNFHFGDTPAEVLLRDWGLLLVALLLAAHPPKRLSLDSIL
jgi:uncharacterized membrane protein YphA (DoxX/SURF4 family)